MLNSTTLIFSSLYFWFVSKDWRWIILFAIFANFIAAVGILFVPESPLYLHATKDYDKARESLNRIARFNGQDTYITELFDVELEEIEEKTKERLDKINKSKDKI